MRSLELTISSSPRGPRTTVGVLCERSPLPRFDPPALPAGLLVQGQQVRRRFVVGQQQEQESP